MNRWAGSRRGERIALAIALIWAGVLLVGAFTVPVYGGEGADSTGAVTQRALTLVGVNGASGVVVAAVPFLLALGTAFALWLRGSSPGAGPVAWTLTILSAVFSMVSILSIGLFAIPVVACLLAACTVHGRTPSAPVTMTPPLR
ncbi:hypothetical protein [Tessaracoccus antarcticus]|uniref:Uncharacterized protein n=1 Tax=Tessaracoccus antarcticus TaxID=2479848 RepID=A0A3M0G8P0_9ACTN|nr:hypothetical protein [Tessaracoccus antarcticus]RMB58782.1 hypothetical protein EAX62_11680 [Tessaracoccus antarcticus]